MSRRSDKENHATQPESFQAEQLAEDIMPGEKQPFAKAIGCFS